MYHKILLIAIVGKYGFQDGAPYPRIKSKVNREISNKLPAPNTNEERKVLRVIAEKEAPLSPKKIHSLIEKNKIGISSENIRKYLQRLAEKKLISKIDRGFYTIPDRMFQLYIRNYSTLK